MSYSSPLSKVLRPIHVGFILMNCSVLTEPFVHAEPLEIQHHSIQS